MATDSKIEWTEHTDNLWHGCTKVHAGCDHCYAETLSHRWGREIWGNNAPRMEVKSVWKDLKKQQAAAAAVGEMHRVFVGSMMDIFEKPMPLVDSKGEPIVTGMKPIAQWPKDTGMIRERFFQTFIPACPNLIFLFLTKRPSNIPKMIPEAWLTNPPTNVMFGTSPCDQATADTLIPQLCKAPGKKFLSIEPLLGPVSFLGTKMFSFQGLPGYLKDGAKAGSLIEWVIVGGESGHHARPMHPDWVRSLRDQCEMFAIPFFFKQWGEYVSVSDVAGDGAHYSFPDGATVRRTGKKAAGRTLDGKEYSEFPWQLFTKNNDNKTAKIMNSGAE